MQDWQSPSADRHEGDLGGRLESSKDGPPKSTIQFQFVHALSIVSFYLVQVMV